MIFFRAFLIMVVYFLNQKDCMIGYFRLHIDMLDILCIYTFLPIQGILVAFCLRMACFPWVPKIQKIIYIVMATIGVISICGIIHTM